MYIIKKFVRISNEVIFNCCCLSVAWMNSPKIYQSMAEPHKHPVCIAMVAAVVFFIYSIIIIVGYAYYGCHTQIPGMWIFTYVSDAHIFIVFKHHIF
jgi:hypothetical protein